MILKRFLQISLLLVAAVLVTCRSRMDARYLSPGAPTVTSISPNLGIVSGGTTVTITGTNFRTGLVSVYIGTAKCTVQSSTATQIICITGRSPRSNIFSVTVTATDTLEAGTLASAFGYNAFLYGATQTPNTYGFTINPFTGVPTAITGPPASPYSAPGYVGYGINVHPSNQWVYVTNAGGNSVTGFTISPVDGSLTALAGMPYAVNMPAGTDAVTFTSDGLFMFVGGTGNPSAVSSYTIDQTTGLPTTTGAAVTATGCNFAGQMVVDPTNRFLYMACNSGGSGGANAGLAAYSIDSTTGVLTYIPGPFTSHFKGGSGDAITMDLSGTFIYMGTTGAAGAVSCAAAGNEAFGGVSVYSIDTGTGVPTYLQTCNHGLNSGAGGTRGSGASVDQTNHWLVTSARTSGGMQIWDISGGTLTAVIGAGLVTYPLAAGTNDSRFDKTGRYMFTNTDAAGGTFDYFSFDPNTGIPTQNGTVPAGGGAGVSDVTY